jgi:hypothetical protein
VDRIVSPAALAAVSIAAVSAVEPWELTSCGIA